MSDHHFGFTWGPMNVSRIAEIKGRRVLWVSTGKHRIEITASPKGNNVQVYVDGERVK